jgi:hypothetical protein
MADEEEQDDKINKDIQAKMEFIVKQQALFAANSPAHDEKLKHPEDLITRLEELNVKS